MSIDREYTIKISTVSDNAGAKAAEDSLKDVGTASEKTGEAGKASAEGMFEKHTELHHLLHAIGQDAVPGMGHAFAMLAMGPLGAVTAMALAVEFVKGQIEQTTKKLDELAANSAKAFGGGDWLTDYVNAAMQAETQTEALAEAMHKAADAGPEIKNRYDAEAKAINVVVDALKTKLKAQEDSDLADARKAGGSPEVAAANEAAIRARYESRDAAVQAAADRALEQARERELAERTRSGPALDAAAGAAQTPQKALQERLARANELSGQEAALAKATADMNSSQNDDLNDKIEGLKIGLENMHKTGTRASIIKAREAEIAELESETAEIRAANAQDRINQLSKEVLADQQNTAKEKIAQEDATNASTENTKRIVELQKQIAEANAAAKIKTESAAQLLNGLKYYSDTKGLEGLTGTDTPAGAADFVQKFLAAQSRLQSRQGAPGDSQTIELMNSLLTTTRQSDQRLFQLLESLLQHNADVERTLTRMQRQYSDLAYRSDRPRN
jgi:hypothetical protein